MLPTTTVSDFPDLLCIIKHANVVRQPKRIQMRMSCTFPATKMTFRGHSMSLESHSSTDKTETSAPLTPLTSVSRVINSLLTYVRHSPDNVLSECTH